MIASKRFIWFENSFGIPVWPCAFERETGSVPPEKPDRSSSEGSAPDGAETGKDASGDVNRNFLDYRRAK
jgi:hypothetical protein